MSLSWAGARRWISLVIVPVGLVALLLAGQAGSAPAKAPLARVELHLVSDAHTRPHVLLMTLGGPIYCGLLLPLAQYLDASRVCPDYGRNGEKTGASRDARVEDWGDPAYLRFAAKLPAQLRAQGVKISKLVLVGVSYSGYANAQLIATHPELRADGLIVIDSYLDLPARYRRLPASHPTHAEMESVLGGSLAERPAAYAARSPSHHLDGLARALDHGTKMLFVWSTAPEERREFNGATCSKHATAGWLSKLATLRSRPVVGYVTRMKHADVLRNWDQHLVGLIGVGHPFDSPLPGRRVVFAPGQPPPRASYC